MAFPTETVYGLGCHALDETAVSKIFAAKERPLTDPLIVHVTSSTDALRLWEANTTTTTRATNSQQKVLEALTERFWPGPLTLVAKAAPEVPSILMANTGYVACRCPSHPLARQLIDAARVPIAAPSANKFGHVSPTRAQHVLDDLQHEDVWIMDAPDVCNVGVESTVAKLTFINDNDKPKVTVLRQGAVSVHDMEDCLEKAGLGGGLVLVERKTQNTTPDHEATVAPGQTVRHYSPNIPSFVLSQDRVGRSANTNDHDRAVLRHSVVIDFGGRLSSWKGLAAAYRDLSDAGNSSQAAQAVFETLRWAEQVEGARQIVFPDLTKHDDNNKDDALLLAVKDRLTRAASGVVIDELTHAEQ